MSPWRIDRQVDGREVWALVSALLLALAFWFIRVTLTSHADATPAEPQSLGAAGRRWIPLGKCRPAAHAASVRRHRICGQCHARFRSGPGRAFPVLKLDRSGRHGPVHVSRLAPALADRRHRAHRLLRRRGSADVGGRKFHPCASENRRNDRRAISRAQANRYGISHAAGNSSKPASLRSPLRWFMRLLLGCFWRWRERSPNRSRREIPPETAYAIRPAPKMKLETNKSLPTRPKDFVSLGKTS